MDLGLAGKACIVTGASRGIGLATARQLASEGANVFLCARDADRLAEAGEEVAEAGRALGARVISAALDVTVADAAERLVGACEDQLGSVDVLVNNAGTSRLASLEELTDADWQQQWELHVMAPMRLMRAAAPRMAAAAGGRIVNVCSSSGKRPSLRNAAYSVSKAAQLSLSRVFADRYARDRICVNAVAPGVVATELWTGAGGLAEQVAAGEGVSREQALAAAAAGIPRGSLGLPEEVAAVIAFLCSQPASNVTGAAWSVDGGTVATIV